MALLGRMERIEDLRTIWSHEAKDFSKWLAQDENLKMLSDTIGISILLTERESAVGDFNVDLYATEELTGRKIIIENQLEDTNHDHLGKIITYASGKDADVIIWIVKHARDEHKQAIEWLNQHTDENIGFFLLETELWRIDQSAPAVRFNVVERPNDWAKTIKASAGLSDTKILQLDYWQAFNQYAFTKIPFAKEFSQRKPQPQHWYDLSVGSSTYHICLTVNTQKNLIGTEIYISNDKETFEQFRSHSNEIEKEFGTKLQWRAANKDCRIIASTSGNIKKSEENWNAYFDWYCDMSLKIKYIVQKYDK